VPRSSISEAFLSKPLKSRGWGSSLGPRVKEKQAMAEKSIIELREEAKRLNPAAVATTFTPLHDRILVRRLEEGETIRGGIIIPDTAKEKPQEGEVIAVGKGKSNDEGKVFPLDVKAGDRVLFGKYSGNEIKLDNEDFLIMREEDVLGIIKK
jgi:chaperonin GroES